MIKHLIITCILSISIAHCSSTPEYIKFCREKCPHKIAAYYNDFQHQAIYIPTNSQHTTFMTYTLYKFGKGNITIFQRDTTHAPTYQPTEREQCFVVATTCQSKK